MPFGFIRRKDYDEPTPNLDIPAGATDIDRHTIRPPDPQYAHVHDAIHRGTVALVDRLAGDARYAGVVRHAVRVLEHDALNAPADLRARYVADLAEALARTRTD